MKKTAILFSILSLFIFPAISEAATLAEKMSGRILLQVEQNGEAYYVYPKDKKGYYLGRPADAFAIMREKGLGIKHDTLNNYISSKFPDSLSGMIMLDVEANGEAYYVYPDDLKGYYLGRPDDAFAIMREKGLGISNRNLFQVIYQDKYSDGKILSEITKDSAQKAAVNIVCMDVEGNIYSGSGVLVTPTGKILTNAHVVMDIDNPTDGDSYYQCIGAIPTAEDSYEPDYLFNIDVTYYDISLDLAFAHITNEFDYEGFFRLDDVDIKDEFPFMNLDVDKKTVGSTIYAIGYPDLTDGYANVTEGKITSKLNLEGFDFFISDVAVSYGNSGGAIYNDRADLLGLVTLADRTDLSNATYIFDVQSLLELYDVFDKFQSGDQTVMETYSENFNPVPPMKYLKEIFDLNGIDY